MNKLQKILEDVERLCNAGLHNSTISKKNVLNTILAVVNDFKEEPVSEDLEEACEQLAENARKHKAETINRFFCPIDYKQGVIDGVQWQKEQMVKDAVNVVIGNEWGHPRCVLTQYDLEPIGIRSKDRVKVIIIKEG